MKTNISNLKHLCTVLLTALAFAACSNDTDDVAGTEPAQPVKDDIKFTAVFGVKNPGTRALTDPGNGTLTASWQQNEEIAIVFGGNKYTATVTEVDGEGNAIVSATLPEGTPNNQAVTYIYPASAADGSGLISDLLSSQDGTLATLSSTLDVAIAEGSIIIDGTNAQPNGTVRLVNQFAVCKFQFKDDSNEAIEDITSLTITDIATTEVITVTTPSAQSAVYVAMPPSNNSTKFELECSSGRLYQQKIAAANLQAGMFYHPTLQIIVLSGRTDEHDWVNLGLPSGTKWATCNVGASSPEDHGYYFAWGETTTKNDYSWSQYKYCEGSQNTLTKYCNSESYGYQRFTDNLTELEAIDDVATVNWSGRWQIPSKEQLEELLDNSNTEWTTQNNVWGYKITSRSNSNSIFLPVTGFRLETSLYQTSSQGRYWSRSLNNQYSYSAYSLLFDRSSIYIESFYRQNGHNVRPVLKQ